MIFDFDNTNFETQKATLEKVSAAHAQRFKTRIAAYWGGSYQVEPETLNADIRDRALEVLFDRLMQYEHGEGGIDSFEGMAYFARKLAAISTSEYVVLLEHYNEYTKPTYEKLIADAEAERAQSMKEYEENNT